MSYDKKFYSKNQHKQIKMRKNTTKNTNFAHRFSILFAQNVAGITTS